MKTFFGTINFRLFLQAILDKKIQQFDYEAIAEEIKDPSTGKLKKRRLVAFGKYAGIAGMIDTFQCLGRRLLASGYSTPFLNCSPAYVYYDLNEAKRGVKEMGKRIEEDGLPMGADTARRSSGRRSARSPTGCKTCRM